MKFIKTYPFHEVIKVLRVKIYWFACPKISLKCLYLKFLLEQYFGLMFLTGKFIFE